MTEYRVEVERSLRRRLLAAMATILTLLAVLLAAGMAPVSGYTEPTKETSPFEAADPSPVNGGPIFIQPKPKP